MTEASGNFCNHDVTIQDWYAVFKSKNLPKGTSRPVYLAKQHLLVRRCSDGKVVAFQRYCPHMGTDLILAKESNNTLQCPFHGLEFDQNGTCRQTCAKSAAYNLKTFKITEKYGFVFIYIGEGEPPALPELNLNRGPIFYSPTQKIKCHHHMILCNGLDHVHTKFVHSWDSFEHEVSSSTTSVVAKLKGVYRAWWMMLLNFTYTRPLEFVFTTYGSGMSVADVNWSGVRLVILFTAYGDGSVSYTNTGLYLSSYNPIRWIRALIVAFGILWQDAKILNSIQIKQNFSKEDAGVIMYKEILNSMPIYDVK